MLTFSTDFRLVLSTLAFCLAFLAFCESARCQVEAHDAELEQLEGQREIVKKAYGRFELSLWDLYTRRPPRATDADQPYVLYAEQFARRSRRKAIFMWAGSLGCAAATAGLVYLSVVGFSQSSGGGGSEGLLLLPVFAGIAGAATLALAAIGTVKFVKGTRALERLEAAKKEAASQTTALSPVVFAGPDRSLTMGLSLSF